MNGAYGVPLAAFDRLGEIMPDIAFAALFLLGVWIVCKVRA